MRRRRSCAADAVNKKIGKKGRKEGRKRMRKEGGEAMEEFRV
jgi:hypothetical protein